MLKHFFLFLILVCCCDVLAEKLDIVERKYNNKLKLVHKTYCKSLIGIKTLMLKDYKALLKKSLVMQKLDDANKLKAKIEKINEEIIELKKNNSAGKTFAKKGLGNFAGNGKYRSKKRIRYATSKGFLNTKIKLDEGQMVSISAIGKWSPNGKIKLDANGVNKSGWKQFNVKKDANHGKLLAYISEDPNFYYEIGTRAEFVTQAAGNLFIGVNDDDSGNNAGSLKIIISY